MDRLATTAAPPLVSPLEDAWRPILDGIARARGWPTSAEIARIAPLLRALSDAYNAPPGERVAATQQAMAARLLFSFPRDVPKGAGAVRELVQSGLLAPAPGRPLRILDVGAGLGATTWGVVRALAAAKAAGIVEATWIDEDPLALDVARAIGRAVPRVGDVELVARTEHRRAAQASHAATATTHGPFDLVLLGQVLSELDPGLDDDARVTRHVELARTFLDPRGPLDPRGALVIVEPALRARTRHLHRVRDALAREGATVFAPCLHSAPCPALVDPTDWCHEDLAIDLPAWLVPIARAAGLRWQGLTFSYLVLRKDGTSLRDCVADPARGSSEPPRARLRVVSNVHATKGKREIFLCGDLQGRPGGRVRAMRLDRDASDPNAPWETLARGDVIGIAPPFEPDRARISRTTDVRVLAPEGAQGAADDADACGERR